LIAEDGLAAEEMWVVMGTFEDGLVEIGALESRSLE
jgi:hypothetical protein